VGGHDRKLCGNEHRRTKAVNMLQFCETLVAIIFLLPLFCVLAAKWWILLIKWLDR